MVVVVVLAVVLKTTAYAQQQEQMEKSRDGFDGGYGAAARTASGYQTLPARPGFLRPVSVIDGGGGSGSSAEDYRSSYAARVAEREAKQRRELKRYSRGLSDGWQSTADLAVSPAASVATPSRDAAKRLSSYLSDALKRRGVAHAYASTANLSMPSSSEQALFGNTMSSYNPEMDAGYVAGTRSLSRRGVSGNKRWSTAYSGFNPQEVYIGSSLPKLEESIAATGPYQRFGGSTSGSASGTDDVQSFSSDIGSETQPSDTVSVSASSDLSDADTSIMDGESVSERILRKSYYSRFNDTLSRRRSASTHSKLNGMSATGRMIASSVENLTNNNNGNSASGTSQRPTKKSSKSKSEAAPGLPRDPGMSRSKEKAKKHVKSGTKSVSSAGVMNPTYAENKETNACERG
ncbi:unnamed protein product [Notodromas monacha]|uniref:Uncharacterized protein n=1 Tax=Notodromas monacha TaxID=399045 RepID=A0A7R9GIT5_9CRUS|nr:unnamed protein product [Notodromas monacha]CAG0922941.1 unnamed protein product [Notodromas monacha]